MRRTDFLILFTIVVAIACSPASLQAEEGLPLRIVTYNGEHLVAPGERARYQKYRWNTAREAQFERIAAVIETLDPDLLVLQEINSAAGVETLVDILHAKGMTDYRGYHAESNDGFTGMDVAVISKYQPDNIDGQLARAVFSKADDNQWREEFTFEEDGQTRTRETTLDRNLLCYFTIGGHKLALLGLHLKSNPDDAYSNGKRTGEARIVQKIIQQGIVTRGYEPIVLGDLNDYDADVPDRDESRETKTKVLALIKDYDTSSPGAELLNAARFIPRQADRYTSHWDRNENGADDPGDVKTMLDHILLPDALQPHIRRAFISHVHGLETSDHFPVVVDLVLPAK